MALYELAALGSPTDSQVEELQRRLAAAAHTFKLEFGKDISLAIRPATFAPAEQTAAAAVFFGGGASVGVELGAVLENKLVPVVPVATTEAMLDAEIPASLRGVNCLFYKPDGPDRIFSTLLSCVGLLRSQRRVFLSYKRTESAPAARQLFEELSARNLTVFLDTHSVPAAVDFQEELWHQLVDVDVVLMLDTPSYFDSRWTQAEYGRALAKNISVLRVQWPGTAPSGPSTAAVQVLKNDDLNPDGTLAESAVVTLCALLEQNRSLAYAARLQSSITAIEDAVSRIEGRVEGVGPHRIMHVRLRNGSRVVVQPIIGVPSAVTLHEAVVRAKGAEAALVYDHIGLKRAWQEHLEWLATNFAGAKWIKVSEVAWAFGGWGT